MDVADYRRIDAAPGFLQHRARALADLVLAGGVGIARKITCGYQTLTCWFNDRHAGCASATLHYRSFPHKQTDYLYHMP